MTDLFSNPYAPPESISELELRVQRAHRAKTPLTIRVLAMFLCGAIVIALGLMAYEIKSIIVSGVAVSILGTVLCIAGITKRNHLAILVGASPVLFSVYIVALINVMEWSPADARLPVQAWSWGYAVIAIPLAIWVAARSTTSSKAVENDGEPIQAASN